MTVDLDAIHRAEAEALEQQPTFKLGGKKWTLVPEISVVGALAFHKIRLGGASYNTVKEFLEHALADEADVDKVLAAGFRTSDAERLMAAWNTDAGESSASPESSNGDGKPSRPTSRRTTPAKPRSAKRSGKRA